MIGRVRNICDRLRRAVALRETMVPISRSPRRRCGLRRVEGAEVASCRSDANLRDPSAARTLIHTINPRPIATRALAVPLVLLGRTVHQVHPAIVRAVAVIVIDFWTRLFARHHLPNDAMRQDSLPVHAPLPIAVAGWGVQGALASALTIPDRCSALRRILRSREHRGGSRPPRQDTGLRVIVEQLAQMCRAWEYLWFHSVSSNRTVEAAQ